MPTRPRPTDEHAPSSKHSSPGLGEIVPPGKLHEEDRDSALTGATRSLQRRVLGLGVLKAAQATRKSPAKKSVPKPS